MEERSPETPSGSLSPEIRRSILEVVKVTPPLLGKYGRRMALPYCPPSDHPNKSPGQES